MKKYLFLLFLIGVYVLILFNNKDNKTSNVISTNEEQNVANSTEKVIKVEESNNNEIIIDKDIMGLFG